MSVAKIKSIIVCLITLNLSFENSSNIEASLQAATLNSVAA